MSYVRKIEYGLAPIGAYKVTRGCSGCGQKQIFASTGNFRINANGNRLDVWLIYQCEKCGHTYNLPIYERVRPGKIPKEEYEAFLSNDADMAYQYGTKKSVFTGSKAEIQWSLAEYRLIPIQEDKPDTGQDKIRVILHNPYGIPIREDKILAEIFKMSRSRIKQLIKEETLALEIRST